MVVVPGARGCCVAFFGGVDRVPEADHEETWFSDPGRPGHGFHGDFSDAPVFGRVSSMDDVAVIMVVSGEDKLDVADFFDDFT